MSNDVHNGRTAQHPEQQQDLREPEEAIREFLPQRIRVHISQSGKRRSRFGTQQVGFVENLFVTRYQCSVNNTSFKSCQRMQ